MRKDFEGWSEKKQTIDRRPDAPFYHEREVWWCSLGVNVGFEQDGTGKNYDRPVVIMRGFNAQTCVALALTGKRKVGKFYVPIGEIEGRQASVILSQIRLVDTKRLIRKMSTLDEDTFATVRDALQHTLFGRRTS